MFREIDKLKALAIVKIFETSKPFGDYTAVAVLNDGAGISYGVSQFTHKSGSLAAVLNRFLKLGGVFPSIVTENLPDIRAKRNIPALSAKRSLKAALKTLGKDPLMQQAQREIAFENYLRPALQACEGSNFVQPLSLAVIYDSMNHGSYDKIRDRVGVKRSQFMADAHFERAWITEYVQERDRWLESIERLKSTDYRTDFFLAQIARNNWTLNLPMNVHGHKLTADLFDKFPAALAEGDDRSKTGSGESPSVDPSVKPTELSDDKHRENAALPESSNSSPAADAQSSDDQTDFSFGGYLKTAQDKFDKVNEVASGVVTRKDSAKSLWTTVGGTLSQAFWGVFAFFIGLPREVWITVAIVAGALTILYLYRQISLGKIREKAKLAMQGMADIL